MEISQDKTMTLIDIEKCPKNKPVKVFYPDGTLITETADDVMFAYILTCIKAHQLNDCYVEFQGEKIMIHKDGYLEKYPIGLFDALTNLQLLLA